MHVFRDGAGGFPRVPTGGKCSQQAEFSGENINITYKPGGTHVAVANMDDELTILGVRKFMHIHKRKFNYEVNEIAWNMNGGMFFLTTENGMGCCSWACGYTLEGHEAPVFYVCAHYKEQIQAARGSPAYFRHGRWLDLIKRYMIC